MVKAYEQTLIYKVLTKYFPDWDSPGWTGKWVKCLCPVHNESRPSCSVSYELDAVNCKGCDFKGDAISIIMRKEGLTYVQAVQYAESIHGGSHQYVPRGAPVKPRRRVFGDEGTDVPERGRRREQVPARLRRRTFGGS